MGLKIVLLALFVLSISWISSGAKDLSASDITGIESLQMYKYHFLPFYLVIVIFQFDHRKG